MSKAFATNPRGAAGRKPPQAAVGAGRKNSRAAKKALDKPAEPLVNFVQSPATPAEPQPATPVATETAPEAPSASTVQEHKMNLIFTRSKAERKDPRLVIFNFADGRPGSVQFLRTAFGDNIPETITMSGEFAEKTEKVAKAKETPEARKARLAALPKLTLAEKVAKAEARVAKMKAKLAGAAQPEPEAVGAM